MWLGTGGGGLNSFENGRFHAFGKGGPVSGVIYSITGDPNGTLWPGTNGSGLVRYKDGRFSALTGKTGFFEDSIFGMIRDDDGNAWLSSNRGIFRVGMNDLNRLADGFIRHLNYREFGQADGMKSPRMQWRLPAFRVENERWAPAVSHHEGHGDDRPEAPEPESRASAGLD